MQLVIIHGWSDSSKNLKPLAMAISKHYKHKITNIFLSNYISLNDEITFADLASAMMQAWQDANLNLTHKSVNIITHSMGALVLRHWLTSFFTLKNQPIANCIMLAPANFGSALAHKGKALLGRIFKGDKIQHPFAVGSKLLNGLELGSNFIWQQALADCFNAAWFNKDNILTTILIGTEGNYGLGALVNETGADGVIRWSAANLSPSYYTLEFNTTGVAIDYQRSSNQVAFRLVPDCNHQTILHNNFKVNPTVLEIIILGLQTTSANFSQWVDQCAKVTNQIILQEMNMQQCILMVRNQYNQPVNDYGLIGCELAQDNHILTDHFNNQVQTNVHTHSTDLANKCFYWNITKFWQHSYKWQQLNLEIIAHPQILTDHMQVGYNQHIWQLKTAELKILMKGNNTVFLNVIIPKVQTKIFTLNSNI